MLAATCVDTVACWQDGTKLIRLFPCCAAQNAPKKLFGAFGRQNHLNAPKIVCMAIVYGQQLDNERVLGILGYD
jgi:hypothetical protein